MKNNPEYIQGRQLVKQDKSGDLAIKNNTCQRCQAHIEKWMVGPQGKYCWTCYQMQTISEKTSLLTTIETNNFRVAGKILMWDGELTPNQKRLAHKLCAETKDHQLVHAVTGAGKTEMLYPVLEQNLRQKKRVAFVAPRVDVVHEIAKRLAPIFKVTQTTMTGDTIEESGHHQLIFATIHQLFKYKEAFDLIIVDECDAFPLYRNKWLHGAIKKALKTNGRLICLTATLPKGLEKTFGIKAKNTLSLFRRFHGFPLPNIQIHFCGNWRNKCPKAIENIVLETKFPLLIFVPHIKDVLQLQERLSEVTGLKVGTAYAGQENRIDVINAFKSGETKILVTTILLERGITFPEIDVLVLGAEDPVFTTATIIQIAGRCGRTKERPTGNVFVYTRWRCRKIRHAYQEIARMNR